MKQTLAAPVAPPDLTKRRRPRLWKIRGELPRSITLGAGALALVLVVGAWTLTTGSGWVSPVFLPAPGAVLAAGARLLASGDLLADTLASLLRVVLGFALSALVGVALGLCVGTFRVLEGFFEPVIGLVRYMPAAAFIPLVILWFGLDEPAKVAIIFLGSVFYNTLMVADAVKFVPSDLVNVAYTLGAGRRDVFLRVILPATLPSILDTLRVNIAGAWNFVVVAELVAANSGLGYRILTAQRFLRTDEIFVGILVIGLIGLAIDFAFKLLSRLVVPWAIEK
jgi:NitT/TauT family transport system permease protein